MSGEGVGEWIGSELRGRPVSGARVSATYEGNPDGSVSTETDTEGRYTLSLPEGGEWTVTFIYTTDRNGAACWTSWSVDHAACEASGTIELQDGTPSEICV